MLLVFHLIWFPAAALAEHPLEAIKATFPELIIQSFVLSPSSRKPTGIQVVNLWDQFTSSALHHKIIIHTTAELISEPRSVILGAVMEIPWLPDAWQKTHCGTPISEWNDDVQYLRKSMFSLAKVEKLVGKSDIFWHSGHMCSWKPCCFWHLSLESGLLRLGTIQILAYQLWKKNLLSTKFTEKRGFVVATTKLKINKHGLGSVLRS